MKEKPKKPVARFPLRLPDDVDAEVRAIARGEGGPPSGINDTIVYLLREAIKARKEQREPKPGQLVPQQLAGLTA